MYDLAHVCISCRTITIFAKEASFPRRCGCCDAILRTEGSSFVARPALDDDDAFTLELGPASMSAAPF